MQRRARAFAPGHITGFFQIEDGADEPEARGSRGAGFSVELGVESTVSVEDEGVPGVTVLWKGRPVEAATTRAAVGLLAAGRAVHVRVEQRLDLPVSQGFGMSAAGALSAALATAHVLGLPRPEALRAAHAADVLQRTGLGDVVGSDAGGFEVRVRPGVPPSGRVSAWTPEPGPRSVLLAVADRSVATRRVLSDPAARDRISRIGGRLVDAFLPRPTLAGFVAASREFAREAGLETPPVGALLEDLGPGAAAAQCQLGGSVFAFDPSRTARARLERLEGFVETRIATRGAFVDGVDD